jgi:hypothetical protein
VKVLDEFSLNDLAQPRTKLQALLSIEGHNSNAPRGGERKQKKRG